MLSRHSTFWIYLLYSFIFLSIITGSNNQCCVPLVSRDDMIARAQEWVDAKVPYSQTSNYHGYRQDCSGYVSMAWKSAKAGHSTYDMQEICHKIDKSELKKGDALLNPSEHVLLFHHWVDDGKTTFMEYAEHTYGQVASHDQRSYKDFKADFFPCRFNLVKD